MSKIKTAWSALSDEQRRGVSEALGPEGYTSLVEAIHSEGNQPEAPDVPKDFSTNQPLPRSKWSTQQKIDYIKKHGKDAYLSIPY